MEGDSQAVLNSLTEYDSQDASKHGRSAGDRTYSRKGTISRLKVNFFDNMAAPVPEIMDD
jgi:hypothetical protein